MTRNRTEPAICLSRVQRLLYLIHPRIYKLFQWCTGITFFVFVVYAANQKISVPNFQWADLSSSESQTDNSNTTNQGSNYASLEQNQHRYIGRKGVNYILQKERTLIARSVANYTFRDSLQLKDLVPEYGGSPIRALVTTTWRSGSTFLGDILVSHPATYYHYEPLLHFGIEQVRDGIKAREALRVLKSLFRCDYSKLGSYLKYGIDHTFLFTHNFHLWKRCQQFEKSLCWNPDFLSRMCQMFPFQSMKTVRLRFKLTKKLLEDSSLNIRALLLVRDPRGTMESRHHRDWCPGNPDCEDPAKLCSDMVEDYHSAQQLSKIFPGRVKVIRYEDFSSDPYNHSKEVLEFFRFNFHPNIQSYLDTHTKINFGGVSSTFRESKSVPFQWRKKLTFEEVETIQANCKQALDLWGYKLASNKDELAQLEPLLPLNITLS